MPGWKIDDPDRNAARLGTVVLGGTFTSRLNRLMREEKAYTYGARSSLVIRPEYGLTVAASAVQRASTATAVLDLLGEMKRIGEGITEVEAGKASSSVITDVVEAMGSREGIVNAFGSLQEDGQSPNQLAEDLVTIKTVTHSDMGTAMAKLDQNAAMVVVVGDVATIQAPLKDAMGQEWELIAK